MQCFIYRSLKKKGLYIYIPEKNNFSEIPDAILNQLGETEFALEIELHPDGKLAKEVVAKAIADLEIDSNKLNLFLH